MNDTIRIRGARENNLKNLSLDIPKNKLVVLTGPSGSGKSTLAMDTLQRECQRQYMESMGMASDSVGKPKVDSIEGLSPSIRIAQHSAGRNPRSTVGTATDLYTHVRFLFARLGERSCPSCGGAIHSTFEPQAAAPDEEEERGARQVEACPHCGVELEKLGMPHFSFNKPEGACACCGGLGRVTTIHEAAVFRPELSLREGGVASLTGVHRDIQTKILVAAGKHFGFAFDPDQPIGEYGEAQRDLLYYGVESEAFKRHYPNVKPAQGTKFEGVIPGLWRRYREKEAEGGYADKDGFFREGVCPDCGGAKLKEEVRRVTVAGASITEVTGWPLGRVQEWAQLRLRELPDAARPYVEPVLAEMPKRLQRIVDVGLGYLSLDRQTTTLSGGEAQRLRLATLLGSGLTGVLYILDEPTTGLHPRDTAGLIGVLRQLRDLGNTVLVIEHDVEMMRAADHLIDIGPGAGQHGGQIVGQGTLEELMASGTSVTGAYLRAERSGFSPREPRSDSRGRVTIRGASVRNLDIAEASFPLGSLVAVTGVSGSGKSTLVFDVLDRAFDEAPEGEKGWEAIEGLEKVGGIALMDQSPLVRMQRSSVATYTDLYTPLRQLFAGLPEAKAAGLGAKHFSFNTPGGRCERCQGLGTLSVELDFLPNLEVRCPACKGKRFAQEVLSVRFRGHSISDLLDLSVEESLPVLESESKMAGLAATLCEVGLGYLKWGQSVKTLSGGEGQRIRLARELSKPAKKPALYLLDEPTAGLHPTDIMRLRRLLDKLVEAGHTVVVVEHSMELVREADWVLDIGPEGGAAGGRLIASGTPQQVAEAPGSFTGAFLKGQLAEAR
ncbi:Excinuclease ABC subunit A-like protein [Paenibacillus pasadenensis]|uniref:UvrABC system protein A n=1 Tax=Paenibacillus pasadenensis TaxID=217090 RepID=A0A2N5NCD2_9BACL|nr:excinuclease ABC subunit UvrA [Paenibacillus pasadenensis]PLT48001.1 Excinuclease ABC subunit A-like protein [Paenibacillus pasadenensis]